MLFDDGWVECTAISGTLDVYECQWLYFPLFNPLFLCSLTIKGCSIWKVTSNAVYYSTFFGHSWMVKLVILLVWYYWWVVWQVFIHRVMWKQFTAGGPRVFCNITVGRPGINCWIAPNARVFDGCYVMFNAGQTSRLSEGTSFLWSKSQLQNAPQSTSRSTQPSFNVSAFGASVTVSI